MTNVWLWGLAAVIGIMMLQLLKGPSMNALLKDARKSDDVSDLMDAAKKLNPNRQFYFYQEAIQRLWESYHRELAAELIREFALAFPEEKITQYWMKQIIEIEGEIARETLGEHFIESYYDPSVANSCGVAG
ncbi:MAG: hypothetical protein CL920_19825 [Deltaproteobacteria bacterium]|nr:hypothetical protein [Deltaproteobacteria bacterium]MBU50939.1 hypothetical protein [Deltaproteobacteria bacterium]|tara:strand:+ start:3664 stop:4059 length:396 start_codon:yes stop_codon:yes gene_type:complete